MPQVEGTGVVPVLWPARLNQIIYGAPDGAAHVLYDPALSEKGVMYCNVRDAPKRSADTGGAHHRLPSPSDAPAGRITCASCAAAGVYTGGAVHVITPHALPMYRDDNIDHKKRRLMDRKDPLKSRLPEQAPRPRRDLSTPRRH